MSDNNEVWATLRKQFPPEAIGKLPRGGTQLDYVGHADVTSRLLEADPTWNWEPLASDENGLPRFDLDDKGRPVGLWIKLTAGGVTRMGYGSCPSNQNDAVKVLIGDALRNAAMRFGVALDLWAKGDRADPTAENPSGSAGHARRGRSADPFEDATPARPRQRPQAVRPTAAEQVAPATGDGEPDKDAQVFADEAYEARTVKDVEAIHERAREAGKIGALIRNPATGKTGQLALFVNWRRQQIRDTDKAWNELNDAAGRHRTTVAELEIQFKTKTKTDLEAASAGQIREFIAAMDGVAA